MARDEPATEATMTARDLAMAQERVRGVLHRRPEMGLHDDAPAAVRWAADTRMVVRHPSGLQFETDMPAELGGSGDRVTPGWMMRAGLAACTATVVAMKAAEQDIALASLEVDAGSRSDTRGLLGMTDGDGIAIDAGSRDVTLRVRLAAPGVPEARLRALVEESCRCSPILRVLENGTAVDLRVEVGATRADARDGHRAVAAAADGAACPAQDGPAVPAA
jgi:uncharacterized OsmC-like protein